MIEIKAYSAVQSAVSFNSPYHRDWRGDVFWESGQNFSSTFPDLYLLNGSRQRDGAKCNLQLQLGPIWVKSVSGGQDLGRHCCNCSGDKIWYVLPLSTDKPICTISNLPHLERRLH